MEAPLYYSIGQHYRKIFGQKVRKIPVAIADDCPNRQGLKGMQTCIFCDAWGSSAYPEQMNLSISEQIQNKMTMLGERHKTSNFLVYFQSYTTTFLQIAKLRQAFDVALAFSGVKGLVIATRPDCLSPALLDLWIQYSKKTYVGIELGVQSFDDEKLKFLRRGHSAQCSIDAIRRLKTQTSLEIGIHLIFGIPGETEDEIIKTAQIVNDLNVDNVKLHNLHVLKNTPLEDCYLRGEFQPLRLPEYSQRVVTFLQRLNPHISVHRLAALSSHWEELVAPEWTRHHMKTSQFILDQMREVGATQGQVVRAEEVPTSKKHSQ